MRVLGLPLASPDVVVSRAASDLAAVARAARRAPEQLDRLLDIGEQLVVLGRGVLELGERIDARAELILALGERIDAQAQAILGLGERIDGSADRLLELGTQMREVGEQIDVRGAEIVERATRVADTGNALVAALPTLERAIEMTTPLEGAIDRVGRLVDRLPGGTTRRRSSSYGGAPGPASDPADRPPDPPDRRSDPPDRSTDPPASPDGPPPGLS